MKRGFTLVEMLVSLVITLIMMAAVVVLFQVISESVANARSGIEMGERLRSARDMLQLDLDHHTAPLTPPLRPEMDQGYFEYVEGVRFDADTGISVNLFGDTDDALLLTVSNASQPFIGKFDGMMVESPLAEVAYFLKQDGPIIDAIASPPVRLFTLYRRVMLVYPTAQPGFSTDVADTFYETFDVSARVDTVAAHRVANTLGDLTKPESRFGRVPGAGVGNFPHRFTTNPLAFASNRLGDDVFLTNVLAFDVQIYDPGAPVYEQGGVGIEPRDPGYAALIGGAGTPVTFGAYVDLGYAPGYTPADPAHPLPLFNQGTSVKSGSTARPFVFDTWSLHYENDGLDQDADGIADAATNGLDDLGNGVDDITERDTLPPYVSKARGVRITIRVYEPSSKQVREAVVIGGM